MPSVKVDLKMYPLLLNTEVNNGKQPFFAALVPYLTIDPLLGLHPRFIPSDILPTTYTQYAESFRSTCTSAVGAFFFFSKSRL